MTQSAVSQQIKNLETSLSKQLFFRRTRVLELTEAGRSYLPAVQAAFETLAEGTRALNGPDLEQVLQVQSNMSFAVFWLAPHLHQLFERQPWLKVNVSTALWEPERTAQAADVEIRYVKHLEQNRSATRLGKSNFYPVCAPHLDVTLENLFTQNLFDCAGLSCTWDLWLQSQGLTMPTGKAVTYGSTFAFSISAALAGGGVALGHDTITAGLLASGRLKKPFAFEMEMQEGYYLLQNTASKHAGTGAKVFCDWLKSNFQTDQNPQTPSQINSG